MNKMKKMKKKKRTKTKRKKSREEGRGRGVGFGVTSLPGRGPILLFLSFIYLLGGVEFFGERRGVTPSLPPKPKLIGGILLISL